MKLLFCCENYHPSRGGVQEVIRQIAENLVRRGHEVHVATSRHPERKAGSINGVTVHGFDVAGNLVNGLQGRDLAAYQDFLVAFDGDAILIKAAQQWSFDAAWPVLPRIRCRKVFVPCGFSALYEPDYAGYFARMPAILAQFDSLVFYSDTYRDIAFARNAGLTCCSIIPNGAAEEDFLQQEHVGLRQRLGIAPDEFVFLSVGSPALAKGFREVAAAFARLDTGGRRATLILNGRWPQVRLSSALNPRALRRILDLVRSGGLTAVVERLFPRRGTRAGDDGDNKRVLMVDLPREDVVAAFREADLFVFASKIEYSPLVLFEAAAAGTPFVTVPVGNAEEIVQWTGGGWLCPATRDAAGYTLVDVEQLAREMALGMREPERLTRLGRAGHAAWQRAFTWSRIAESYEAVLAGRPVADFSGSFGKAAGGAPVS